MELETIRMWNFVLTAMLILVPGFIYFYRIDAIATITWGPAGIFAVFLIFRHVYKGMQRMLMTNSRRVFIKEHFAQTRNVLDSRRPIRMTKRY